MLANNDFHYSTMFSEHFIDVTIITNWSFAILTGIVSFFLLKFFITKKAFINYWLFRFPKMPTLSKITPIFYHILIYWTFPFWLRLRFFSIFYIFFKLFLAFNIKFFLYFSTIFQMLMKIHHFFSCFFWPNKFFLLNNFFYWA